MADEKPVSGGGYNINWDEIDENTNPFSSGLPFGGSKITSSPPAKTPESKSKPEQTSSNTPPSDLTGNIAPDCPPLSEVAKEKNELLEGEIKSDLAPTIKDKKARPVPPTRTVSTIKPDTDRKELDEKGPMNIEDVSDVIQIPPPVNFVPEEEGDDGYLGSADNPRRFSNSSAATFDLASGNRSPLPEAEIETVLPMDEELASLRADKENLTTLVADMQRCIAEYERSLRQLADEKTRAEDSAKESVIDIIAERDQAIEEISTIEKAFGDLHRRFEKSKQIIEGFKSNEEVLKKTAEEYQNQLKRQEQKYQSLKVHAEQQLLKVSEETERVKRANDNEVTGLRAAIKRSELQIRSLESQLEQKIRENTELTKICDELLSKYGDKG